MSNSLQYLIQHGPMLLAGSSLLLAVGTIAVLVQRSPVHRQRTGELTAMAVLVWLVLANVPLPRLALEEWTPTAAISRTQQSSVARPPTEGLTETNQTRDNTEIIVATLDEVGDAAAQYQQDSVIPEPNVTLEPMAVEQVPSEQIAVELPTATAVEPAAVAVVPVASAPIHYEKWLATIFLSGAGVCISWLLLGRLLLSRVLRTSGKPDKWLRELYLSLPCRRRPQLLISRRAGRAFSFGLVRPVIVLPKDCCSTDKIDQLRAVLLHELAHTEQGDAWGRLLFNAAFPLLYFHPLYWVLRRRTFMAAELIADDRAAAQTSRASYTQELIALVRAGGKARLGHLGAMPVFESQTRFSRRMEMLMRRESCLPYRCTASRRAVYAVLFVLVVAVSGGLLGIKSIHARSVTDITEESTSDEVEAMSDGVADGGLSEDELGSPTDYRAAAEGGGKGVDAESGEASVQKQLQQAKQELVQSHRTFMRRKAIDYYVGSLRSLQINPESFIESLYRSVLKRNPKEQELKLAAREIRRHLATAADRKKAVLDLFDLLASTREFEDLALLDNLRKKSQPKPKTASAGDTVNAKQDAQQNEAADPLHEAVLRGVVFLRRAQRADGTWLAQSDSRQVGTTALCTLALLKSGTKVTDTPIQKALSALRKAEPKTTYGIALQTIILCAAEPKKDLALIQRNVDLLEASQLTDGPQRGGWTYRRPENLAASAGDNSNSGFAIWALDEAAHAGAKVKQQTWDLALSQWRKGQRPDGSWGYMNNGTDGTGSMTCTGIASLAICLNHKPAEKVTKEDTDALDRGIVWLTKNFAVNQNPGSKAWKFYYLMKLRHVGEQTGVRMFGDHDWYSEMAESLVKQQNPRHGNWSGIDADHEVKTALALLALQAGPPPQLAADAGRTWGAEGRVVDELNEPITDATVIAEWFLGGQRRHSVARTDQQGRFVFVHPPTYVNVTWRAASLESGIGVQAKVIERKPLVLQLSRYRMGIQGIWKVVSWEQAGKHEKPDEFKNRQLHIDYNTVSVWDGDQKVSEESYQIDPAVKPQQIDLTANDKKTLGIFRLQGNRLTLCLDRVGRGRPLKFASEVVSPNECLVGLMRYDDRNEIIRGEGINVSANARIAAALKERTQLTFVNMPLSSGLEYIGALHNIDVDIDQASLKNAAVATTTPVTIDVRSVRLGVALKMWLRPLKLGYVLRDGRLVVTSRQDAATDLPKYVADKDEQQSDVARMIQVQLHKLQALESTRAGLRHAAEGYEQLHSKYRSQLGGLQARFHMGLCLQKLGQTEKASAIFDELLKLPNKPEAIHALKAEVRQQVALNAKSSLPGAAFGLPKSDNSVASAEKDKPLDLIQLATTYVDAVGAMELAQLKMKRLDQLVESGAVTKLDAETARLATKTAERKVALLKAIIEQEIEATIENRKAAESRLKYEQAQFRQGNAKQIPSGSRIRQLDGRLRTLRLILKP